MKVEHYNAIMQRQIGRRKMLQALQMAPRPWRSGTQTGRC